MAKARPVLLAPGTLCVHRGETLRVVSRHGQAGVINFRHEETGDPIALTDQQIRIAHAARDFYEVPDQPARVIEHDQEGVDRRNPELPTYDDRQRANIKRLQPYMEAWYRLAAGDLVIDSECQPPSRSRADRMKAARAVAQQSGHRSPPGYSTIARYFRVWVINHDPNSLKTQHHKKGNQTPRIHPDVESIIQNTIKEKHLTPQPVSVAELTRTINKRVLAHFAGRQMDPGFATTSPVSQTTVGKRVKAIPAKVRTQAHFGHKQAERDHHVYATQTRPDFPLELVQSDHTGLPVYLLDQQLFLPLGPANLTCTFDAYSTCVLSAVIYLDDPSFDTIADSLRWTLTPKDDIAEKLGVSLLNTWNQYGYPRELRVDLGPDYVSNHLDETCLQLGIQLTPLPGKSPNLKGSIERFFRTLKTHLRETYPGTRAYNLVKQLQLTEKIDPKKTAIMTLEDLQRAVTKWIVDVYHQQPHPKLPKSRQQVWDEGGAQGTRLPPDPALVKVATGRTIYRTLQHYGIEFNRLIYQSPELGNIRAFHERGKPEKVKVSYYNDDCTRVDIHDPRTGEAIPAFANYGNVLKDMSHWQWDVLRARLTKERTENIDEAAILRARSEIEETVADILGTRNARHRRKAAAFNASGTSAFRENREPNEPQNSGHTTSAGGAGGDDPAAPDGPRPDILDTGDAPLDEDEDGWGSSYDNPRT